MAVVLSCVQRLQKQTHGVWNCPFLRKNQLAGCRTQFIPAADVRHQLSEMRLKVAGGSDLDGSVIGKLGSTMPRPMTPCPPS